MPARGSSRFAQFESAPSNQTCSQLRVSVFTFSCGERPLEVPLHHRAMKPKLVAARMETRNQSQTTVLARRLGFSAGK